MGAQVFLAPGFCQICVLPHLERTRHGTQGNEGCSGHVAIWHHCGDCDSHRIESCGLQEGACQPCSGGDQGSEVHREVHRPWFGNAEVEDKASDESRQEGDVRQGRRGKGKASQEGCQVLCSGSAEEKHLISHFQVCAWTLHASQVCDTVERRSDECIAPLSAMQNK